MMLTLNFALFPLLITDKLLLRQVNESDVNEVYFLRSDERVLKFLDRAPAKSPEEALIFIEKINDLEKSNEAVTWAITLKEDTKLIGTIGFWNIQKEHNRAEIGYVLHPDFHSKGIMQEAMTEVIKFGLQVMKLHSIEANTNPDNTASIKLLERNKFIREGYFRENYFFAGKFYDSVIYSLLATG